nr:MAG TPA: hypothetical protein [Caudoviricetes sp.]
MLDVKRFLPFLQFKIHQNHLNSGHFLGWRH